VARVAPHVDRTEAKPGDRVRRQPPKHEVAHEGRLTARPARPEPRECGCASCSAGGPVALNCGRRRATRARGTTSRPNPQRGRVWTSRRPLNT
jgi:hypothetical protein